MIKTTVSKPTTKNIPYPKIMVDGMNSSIIVLFHDANFGTVLSHPDFRAGWHKEWCPDDFVDFIGSITLEQT